MKNQRAKSAAIMTLSSIEKINRSSYQRFQVESLSKLSFQKIQQMIQKRLAKAPQSTGLQAGSSLPQYRQFFKVFDQNRIIKNYKFLLKYIFQSPEFRILGSRALLTLARVSTLVCFKQDSTIHVGKQQILLLLNSTQTRTLSAGQYKLNSQSKCFKMTLQNYNFLFSSCCNASFFCQQIACFLRKSRLYVGQVQLQKLMACACIRFLFCNQVVYRVNQQSKSFAILFKGSLSVQSTVQKKISFFIPELLNGRIVRRGHITDDKIIIKTTLLPQDLVGVQQFFKGQKFKNNTRSCEQGALLIQLQRESFNAIYKEKETKIRLQLGQSNLQSLFAEAVHRQKRIIKKVSKFRKTITLHSNFEFLNQQL